ncbi:universal stress protein [Streptomyces sp. TLI_171]|uniref:universal stress protein n=1 Tax=Streptomyces sp. TLI_171 TaxID=1938859 RepID=UPI000C42B170|nr:universal stress protein [Streptomyces sp. TLI_171]RKE05066.1 nucleotide-binding universal stress UspA family protein [Streptomyces sp. TLI_171]
MSDSVSVVVVGVDGSAESAAAARWAASDALRRRVPLRLVHVVPEGSGLPHPEAAAERLPDFAVALRAEIAHALPQLDVSCGVVPGHPWSTLVAAGERAGLLVLGSTGPGVVTGRLLGSVALRAAGEARCPVVLVPVGAAGPDGGSGGVVVGLRGDRQSDAVLEFAFEEAARRGVPLRALEGRVEPDAPLRTDAPVGPEEIRRSLVESRTVRLRDALVHWRGKFPEVRTEAEVSGRGAARTLLEASRSADLLVLGRRAPAHPTAAPKPGPVAHAVVHHAHGPVAVVPHA